MLKINHFTKTYGDKKAVDDLSLHIQAGEIYGFIGHNGAGKTTTLKSVAGIMQFDQGEILAENQGKNIAIGTHGTALSSILNYYRPNFGCEDFLRIVDWMPYIVELTFDGEKLLTFRELAHIEKPYKPEAAQR